MSHFSIRASIAAGLVTAIALSGCSSSESSGVRTRNSASLNTCVGVYPSLIDSTIEASISDPECATALVDVSPRHYRPAINTYNTEPYADRRDPSMSAMSFNHNDSDFDIAYEARDSKNTPIEYVRAKGNGSDKGTITYSRSKINAIDQKDSCIQPVGAGSIGFSPTCAELDSFQSTLYVGKAGSQRILYELTKIRGTYGFEIDDSNFAVGLGYYSVVGLVDGAPHTKMVITRPDATTISVKSYRYATPTVMYQFDEGTPTSSSVSPDETSTTLGNEEATTTTIIDSPSTTTPTSEENTTTSAAPAPVAATRAQIQEACGSLDGVEVFPGLDSWKDSTRFEISVSNDCLRQISSGALYSSWTQHSLRATNKSDGRKVNFYATGNDNGRIQFNGRLYAGDWRLTLQQTAYAESSDNKVDAYKTINVEVTADTENPWDLCSPSDAQWNGSELSLDCTFTTANVHYLTTEDSETGVSLLPNASITLPNIISGWVPVSIEYNVDGFNSFIYLMVCASNCDQLNSPMPLTISRNGSLISIDAKSDECTFGEFSIFSLYYFSQVNEKLMFHSPKFINSYLDGALTVDTTTTLNLPDNVDHLFVYRTIDIENPACREQSNFDEFQWSLLALPKATSSSSIPTEETVSISPLSVDVVEFSRTDSNGSPVIISNDQTVIEIPVAALPNSLSDPNSSVQSVSVRLGGDKWTRVSQQLPTLVAVNKDASAMEVKYEFEDGSEAVVTKPLQDAVEYDLKVKESESSSSSSLPMFAIIALVVIAVGGAGLVIRRRK